MSEEPKANAAPATSSEVDHATESTESPRRDFLRTAAAVGAAALAAGLAGCEPKKEEMKDSVAEKGDAAAAPTTKKITWNVQTAWDPGTFGYQIFEKFAKRVEELTGGRLAIEPLPNNAKAKTFDMFAAVKAGDLDGMHAVPIYWAKDQPVCNFLCSYPLGMDRPDQWETWYYELGGLELARKAYEANDLYFIGPIQHDLNIIHSKVPIKSFEDFKKKKIRMPGGLIGEVFTAAGADVATFPGGKVYGALKDGQIEAADFVGPAVNLSLGFAEICKYVILGPPSTPSIHQPIDMWEMTVNLKKWKELPPDLQSQMQAIVREFSWNHFAAIQHENMKAWPKYREKGVDILRLTENDVSKFRKIAVPLWFKWAKKDPLSTQAFKSQLEFMRSDNIGYVTDAMLVDEKGQKLTI